MKKRTSKIREKEVVENVEELLSGWKKYRESLEMKIIKENGKARRKKGSHRTIGSV